MRILYWIVTLVLAAVAVVFAVANREPVAVWPLFQQVPLYLVVLLALLLGFLAGEFVAWAHGAKARRLARERARRIAALERELAATQAIAPPAPPAQRALAKSGAD